MFEFLEDNCLIEWWSDDFQAWYYGPYRSIIDQGLPLSHTEASDFSVKIPKADVPAVRAKDLEPLISGMADKNIKF